VSYDVYLLPREVAGDDPEAAYERLEETDEDGASARPTPQREQQLRAIAADLQAGNPHLELGGPFEDDYWTLQLGDDRPDTALVEMYGGYATAQISYGADDAATAVGHLLDVVRVFETHGYVAYDPQLERVVRPEADAAEIERIVTDIRDRTQSILTDSAPAPRRRGLISRLFGR
jgi:hypothetical protein